MQADLMGERPALMPRPVVVVPMILLLLALAPWPYGFYVLLRLVVCLASVFIAWRIRALRPTLFWVFVGLAILYNPIVPVPMERKSWALLNLLSLVPFGLVHRHTRKASA